MDYLHTHPGVKLRFFASDMQLHIDSDDAYLVAPKAKSWVAGYLYLSDKYKLYTNIPYPSLNELIHVECVLLKHIVHCSDRNKWDFHNCKAAIPILHMLSALWHPQSIVPLKVDNATAAVFSNSTLKNTQQIMGYANVLDNRSCNKPTKLSTGIQNQII